MKKILINISVLFTLMITVMSCAEEDHVTNGPGARPDTMTLTFGVYIPGEQVISTRGEAIQSGVISTMYVLLFDSDGQFISRTQAIKTTDPGIYNIALSPADPETPANKKKQIVHFVCNYDWSGFPDEESIGRHENELITELSVTDKQVAYWQRVELDEGVVENAFPNTIELLRNVAKITVLNNSSSLSGAQFALGDYRDRGAVAPFNSAIPDFEEGIVFESSAATLGQIDEAAFVDAVEEGSVGEPILCYEAHNSLSETPMYILLKGKYGTDQAYTYYKIDIVEQGEEILYDILRNHHYIIDIQEITAPGSSTLEEAAANPSSNHLLYSVLLQDYTAISDGRSALKVETTLKTLVQTDNEFTISFSYIPDILTGVEENDLVDIELQQIEQYQVVVPSSQHITSTSDEAYYQATTASIMPATGSYTAKLVFTAKKDNIILRRTVNLILQKPYTFEQTSMNPSVVPAAEGETVDISFTIPAAIDEKSFPIEFFITTLSLTPNLDYVYEDNLTLDYQTPGTYRYKYVAQNPGDHTLHFKTTSSATDELLLIESELFLTNEIVLEN